MTKHEQKELLIKISNTLCGIFDGIYGEFDDEMNESICEVEKNVATLLRSFEEEEEEDEEDEKSINLSINYYEFFVPDHLGVAQREYRDFTYDRADDMMRKVCQIICFSDCSEEYIDKVVYRGRELEYVG